MVDHEKVIGFLGICRYGNDWRKQPGELGFGVGTNGYRQLIDRFFRPLLVGTGCHRLMLHKVFPDKRETDIPFDGPIRLEQEFPDLAASYDLLLRDMRGVWDDIEIIEYHGCATEVQPCVGSAVARTVRERLSKVLRRSARFGLSVAFDKASALDYNDTMVPVIWGMHHAATPNRRVYIEQRQRVEQGYFNGIPTFTLLSELTRQNDRGGEPSLMPFDFYTTENVLAIDVPPPDRDPMESWDAWIVDQVEAFQADGFTVAVPIHSMVDRKRWDLLKLIFGEP